MLKPVTVRDGIVLHYDERGHGAPLVCVHASLADYSVWSGELAAFSAHYRVIAYSRRYNFPNTNAIRPGHSAIEDANDLAAFIAALDLGPVHVVGHSYGALTTLVLATRYPELLRSIVVAEPPAVPLLAYLSADHAATGQAMLEEAERVVTLMQAAWQAGEREEGMRIFFTWQTGNPACWDSDIPDTVRQTSRRNFAEWDAVIARGEFFPPISLEALSHITAPALVISGARTTPYLARIAEVVSRTLGPLGATHVVVPRAGHAMFTQQPEATREAILDFLKLVPAR